MTLSITAIQKLQRHGWTDGSQQKPKECYCKHKFQGTGGIFVHGIGMIYCANCLGYQEVRKPIYM